MKEHFIDREVGGENAVLVHIEFAKTPDSEDCDEFLELVRSAGINIIELVRGNRTAPSPKFFVGSGKADEIKNLVHFKKADVVIFNHSLSPAQGRNLEQLINCRVVDRTDLILDIFAQRARTFEGKLQVELAQLQHLSTRLVRGWTHLERQKGGIGLRGPGETQLESDRRLIGQRIQSIRKKLAKVVSQREQNRRKRQKAVIPTVALVGYTNAGKSTLFNTLTKSDEYAADQLFATLDPTLRQIKLPQLGDIVFADTVGFIRHLPPDLVASFRATLEETRLSSLLLHVVDAHQPTHKAMLEEVDKVLKEIDADTVPQLIVYNKVDLFDNVTAGRVDVDEKGRPWRVWVSGMTGAGIDALLEAIVELLSQDRIYCCVKLAASEGRTHAELYRLGVIQDEQHAEEGGWLLKLDIKQKDYRRLFAA